MAVKLSGLKGTFFISDQTTVLYSHDYLLSVKSPLLHVLQKVLIYPEPV